MHDVATQCSGMLLFHCWGSFDRGVRSQLALDEKAARFHVDSLRKPVALFWRRRQSSMLCSDILADMWYFENAHVAE